MGTPVFHAFSNTFCRFACGQMPSHVDSCLCTAFMHRDRSNARAVALKNVWSWPCLASRVATWWIDISCTKHVDTQLSPGHVRAHGCCGIYKRERYVCVTPLACASLRQNADCCHVLGYAVCAHVCVVIMYIHTSTHDMHVPQCVHLRFLPVCVCESSCLQISMLATVDLFAFSKAHEYPAAFWITDTVIPAIN